MSRKLSVSKSRKDFIRDNFATIKKSTLKDDELKYYILVENGRKRSKKAIRFQGQYLSGEIVEIIKKVALRKKLSIDEYLELHARDIIMLIESGFTQTFKRVDHVIDLIAASKKKTIEIVRDPDGNIIERVKRLEAIQELSEFQNHVKSSSNIVELLIKVKIYKTGKIRITLPYKKSKEDIFEEIETEGYDELDEDLLTEFLDQFEDIDYIESDPKEAK